MEHKETEENAMKKYTDMSLQERQAEYAAVQAEYEKLKAMGLSLNMARGKPSPQQTALSRPMLDLLTSESDLSDEGVAADNYGCPEGLPSARRLAAELLGVDEKNVLGEVSVTKSLDKCPSLMIPNDFLCPITLAIMRDPVIVATGQVYQNSPRTTR